MSVARESGGPGASSALILSLDFELAWGLRERAYAPEQIEGARAAVPALLDVFNSRGVSATWAVVGSLLAPSRDELERHRPTSRPAYDDPALSSYEEALGSSEEDDPAHFARSLVARIGETPGQELATHTFSHYYPNEPGQREAEFRADLAAAVAIAGDTPPTSIVFPRNQHNPGYDGALLDAGITAYRGNPESGLWNFTTAREAYMLRRRAGRLVDAYLDLDGHNTQAWTDVLKPSGLADVRASRFLRPVGRGGLERLRLRRICKSIRYAAESGLIYHLWWHPHNFALRLDDNLAFLNSVLDAFEACRERHGMESLTMRDVAERARALGA